LSRQATYVAFSAGRVRNESSKIRSVTSVEQPNPRDLQRLYSPNYMGRIKGQQYKAASRFSSLQEESRIEPRRLQALTLRGEGILGVRGISWHFFGFVLFVLWTVWLTKLTKGNETKSVPGGNTPSRVPKFSLI